MSDRTPVVDVTLLPVQAGADRSHVVDAALLAFTVAAVISTGALCSITTDIPAFEVTSQIQGPVELEALEVSGTIIPGEVAVVAASLEAYEVGPGQGLHGSAALEAYSASATLARGDLASIDATISGYAVESLIGRIGDASIEASLLQYTAAGEISGGTAAAIAASLAEYGASGTVIPGNVMRAAVETEAYQAQAVVYTNGTFSVDASLLPFTVQGRIEGPAVEVATAIALNTRTRAVTEYANAPYNSMCSFQGVVLMGTSDGLMSLQGTDDDGEEIACALASGVSNLGSDQQKHVPEAFIGYRAADMVLSVTVDEDQTYEYDLEPRQGTNLHPSRVKLGRGMKGAHWQWRLENRDGGAFDVNYLKLIVEDRATRL